MLPRMGLLMRCLCVPAIPLRQRRSVTAALSRELGGLPKSWWVGLCHVHRRSILYHLVRAGCARHAVHRGHGKCRAPPPPRCRATHTRRPAVRKSRFELSLERARAGPFAGAAAHLRARTRLPVRRATSDGASSAAALRAEGKCERQCGQGRDDSGRRASGGGEKVGTRVVQRAATAARDARGLSAVSCPAQGAIAQPRQVRARDGQKVQTRSGIEAGEGGARARPEGTNKVGN